MRSVVGLAVVLFVFACTPPEPGPAGERGPAGPVGPKGDKGEPGTPANVPQAVVVTKPCEVLSDQTNEASTRSEREFGAVFELPSGFATADAARLAVVTCGTEHRELGEDAPDCQSVRFAVKNSKVTVSCGDDRRVRATAQDQWTVATEDYATEATLRIAP